MYHLVLSEKFSKQIGRLSLSDRKLKLQIKKTLILLNANWEHPSLRMHKLSGRNIWSISVNRSIRIIAKLEKNLLFLLEIGKHEDVY